MTIRDDDDDDDDDSGGGNDDDDNPYDHDSFVVVLVDRTVTQ